MEKGHVHQSEIYVQSSSITYLPCRYMKSGTELSWGIGTEYLLNHMSEKMEDDLKRHFLYL